MFVVVMWAEPEGSQGPGGLCASLCRMVAGAVRPEAARGEPDNVGVNRDLDDEVAAGRGADPQPAWRCA